MCASTAAPRGWSKAELDPADESHLALRFQRWAEVVEDFAGGTFFLPHGAAFCDSHLWWGKKRLRPDVHEGVDLCFFVRSSRCASCQDELLLDAGPSSLENHTDACNTGNAGQPMAAMSSVQAGFPLPAVADGEIVACFCDFIADTIVMRHEEFSAQASWASWPPLLSSSR